MKIYNTLTRKTEEFKPIKEGYVGIYSCGPTVYWNQHIGNVYAYIQWDTMVRALRYQGYKVKWVMNITDVGHNTSDADEGEDKMEKGARREGLSVWQIADKYIAQFTDSLNKLDVHPDVLARATEHIQEQVDLARAIEKNGFAYKTNVGLVYDTSKFLDYAKFAKLNNKDQQAGARTEVDIEKRQPWNFLLWVTNQPNHIMQWDSPWGKGFPGWHLECTAMSTKYLGKRFDIHTGGKEHIPVHHSNEIAQAYGAFGQQTANYWLHNEWLTFGGEKVSKSSGKTNILVTDLIIKGYDPLALRYLVLSSNYQKGLSFTWESLDAAQKALTRLRIKVSSLNSENGQIRSDYKEEFINALNDNLNFTKALSVLWELLNDEKVTKPLKYETALSFDTVLGLNLSLPPKEESMVIPRRALELAKLREKLRVERRFEVADKIRQEIRVMGYEIEDTKTGVKWHKAE
jgi:cysteinyl-tRNA synthetase